MGRALLPTNDSIASLRIRRASPYCPLTSPLHVVRTRERAPISICEIVAWCRERIVAVVQNEVKHDASTVLTSETNCRCSVRQTRPKTTRNRTYQKTLRQKLYNGYCPNRTIVRLQASKKASKKVSAIQSRIFLQNRKLMLRHRSLLGSFSVSSNSHLRYMEDF